MELATNKEIAAIFFAFADARLLEKQENERRKQAVGKTDKPKQAAPTTKKKRRSVDDEPK
jgi:hypothetical protein